ERGLPHDASAFPSATLLINLLGSFLLGALVVAVTEVRHAHPLVRPALGTGLLGGFTTFSTFAVEARTAPAGTAIAYIGASVFGGIALAFVGMQLVRSLAGVHVTETDEDEIDPIDPDLP
ncbi:MAG TPA: CrcB family protein, partial [Jatrophihabitantaceae bacterium]|nr:CrcB family protein [Jatrophihabitantaceae bacterium]